MGQNVHHISWERGNIQHEGWSNWESFYGTASSPVTAYSKSENELDIFVAGIGSDCLHKAWNGLSWGEWEAVGYSGGATTHPINCVSIAQNRIDIVGVDMSQVGAWHSSQAWTDESLVFCFFFCIRCCASFYCNMQLLLRNKLIFLVGLKQFNWREKFCKVPVHGNIFWMIPEGMLTPLSSHAPNNIVIICIFLIRLVPIWYNRTCIIVCPHIFVEISRSWSENLIELFLFHTEEITTRQMYGWWWIFARKYLFFRMKTACEQQAQEPQATPKNNTNHDWIQQYLKMPAIDC